jgi:hypothetical protein
VLFNLNLFSVNYFIRFALSSNDRVRVKRANDVKEFS